MRFDLPSFSPPVSLQWFCTMGRKLYCPDKTCTQWRKVEKNRWQVHKTNLIQYICENELRVSVPVCDGLVKWVLVVTTVNIYHRWQLSSQTHCCVHVFTLMNSTEHFLCCFILIFPLSSFLECHLVLHSKRCCVWVFRTRHLQDYHSICCLSATPLTFGFPT